MSSAIPNDAELRGAMEELLLEADVSDMTLKTIRAHLESKFSCDLSGKKEVLKSCLAELMAADDDNDAEEVQSTVVKVKKTGANNAFTRPVQLSTKLAEFMGEVTMPRTEVTKRMWAYIKENGLQNPNDKREIICDAKLLKVFDGKKKFGMFKMTKYLSEMMKSVKDLVDEPEPPGQKNSAKKRKVAEATTSDSEENDNKSKKSKSSKASNISSNRKSSASSKKSAASINNNSSSSSSKSGSKVKTEEKPKKKKVKAEIADGEPALKPTGGYNKECRLNKALADVIDCSETISRPSVVKKMWEYIRAHDLQNPADKREILLDGKLKKVFKVDSFTMFSMNKYLSDHIKAL